MRSLAGSQDRFSGNAKVDVVVEEPGALVAGGLLATTLAPYLRDGRAGPDGLVRSADSGALAGGGVWDQCPTHRDARLNEVARSKAALA